MSKLDARPIEGGGTMYCFWCPGCDEPHSYYVGYPKAPSWTFNGDVERPTFTPSLLHNGDQRKPADGHRCHLYLTDGRLNFLADCTHALAGQTVDMAEFPEGWL